MHFAHLHVVRAQAFHHLTSPSTVGYSDQCARALTLRMDRPVSPRQASPLGKEMTQEAEMLDPMRAGSGR